MNGTEMHDVKSCISINMEKSKIYLNLFSFLTKILYRFYLTNKQMFI